LTFLDKPMGVLISYRTVQHCETRPAATLALALRASALPVWPGSETDRDE